MRLVVKYMYFESQAFKKKFQIESSKIFIICYCHELPILLNQSTLYLKLTKTWPAPLPSSAIPSSDVTSPLVCLSSMSFLLGERDKFWISNGSLSICSSSRPAVLGNELLRAKLPDGESEFVSGADELFDLCICWR